MGFKWVKNTIFKFKVLLEREREREKEGKHKPTQCTWTTEKREKEIAYSVIQNLFTKNYNVTSTLITSFSHSEHNLTVLKGYPDMYFICAFCVNI